MFGHKKGWCQLICLFVFLTAFVRSRQSAGLSLSNGFSLGYLQWIVLGRV